MRVNPESRVAPPAGPDPSGSAAGPGPSRSAAGSRSVRRRWLQLVAAGWALLLLVAAAVSVRRDAPTVREQRSLTQAVPVVDRATEDLIAAAGPDAVVELADRRVDEGCRITPLRGGAELESILVFRTSAADGASLLDRIAAGLPAAYRAGTRRVPGEPAPRLRADAGEFVVIRGTVTEPGTIEVTLHTGCRPTSGDVDVQAGAPAGSPIDEEPTRALAALGVPTPVPVERLSAACRGGGAIHTARATGVAAGGAALAQALPAPAGAVVVTDSPERYAYRHGPLSLVAEAIGGEVRVTATTVC